MRHKYSCVLTLVVCGASGAYSQITLNTVPGRAIGTPGLAASNWLDTSLWASPNLVEGREFYAPQAAALDTSVSPPILYISDFINNRVLAWKNATGFGNGQGADLVIGQPDFVTTAPQGPGVSVHSTGLSRPSGLAVDASGNLYVVDGGNNRILRFPRPFAQTSQFPNLAIGQATYTTGRGANYPAGRVTGQGLNLSNGSTVVVSNLAFDSSGNLWVIDTGNLRILRFNASDLSGSAPGGLTADLVLGQPDMVTTQTALSPTDPNSYLKLNQLLDPAALAFDPNGNLFVGDTDPTRASAGRVLVFAPQFSSGMSASTHILGVFPLGYKLSGTPAAQQAQLDSTEVYGPSAFFFLAGGGSGVGVVDAGFNRIMMFDTFANWPADGTPPQAKSIIGQPNATCAAYPVGSCKAPNNGSLTGPTTMVLSSPAGAAYYGTDLFVVDAGNNRVVDLPQQGSTFGSAYRILGQDTFTANSPNLIEGREFQFASATSSGELEDAGMALDNSTGTPHLYVADPYNNRVLGFKDLRKFQTGAPNKADIVLGQADFTTALINFPTGDPNQLSKSGLNRPIGLAVDAQGNLYVADSSNGRVLRFPAPFAYTGAKPEPADLVLGQRDFTSDIKDPSFMAYPYGLAFSPSCNPLTPPCPAPNGLLVSDQLYHRVLYIPTSNGIFNGGVDNGKAATVVFGQPGLSSVGSGSTAAALNSPHHISCDTNGNVYVADTGNNRVLIFPDPHSGGTAAFGQQGVIVGGLSSPQGVYANPVTGEIWVANTGTNSYVRYANPQTAELGQTLGSPIVDSSPNVNYSSPIAFHPLAVLQDQSGNLFGADDAHRVALYFTGMYVENSASFAVSTNRPLAPGAIATIYKCTPCQPNQFIAPNTGITTYPVPKTLADLQVQVNGVASPLYFVSGGQINFIVPGATPTSGSAEVEVVQVSTGQVLGAAQVPMASYSPGAFIGPGGWTGTTFYAAAINADGTVNSASNPAQRGQYVSLYMTGQGNIQGAPQDGYGISSLSTPYTPTVVMNGVQLDPSNILYSGLNAIPGVWQINLTIPNSVVTTNGVWFAVITPDLQPNWNSSSGYLTYLYVK